MTREIIFRLILNSVGPNMGQNGLHINMGLLAFLVFKRGSGHRAAAAATATTVTVTTRADGGRG